MKTQVAECAFEIRKELKALGFKATVTSKSYSMGDEVTVTLNNIADNDFKMIKTLLCKYKRGDFNAMTDTYEHKNLGNDMPKASFLFVGRN